MMKMVVCSVLNLFVIMLHSQLVLSQLPDDQVSAMTSVYKILQNNTFPSFVWNDVLEASNPCSWKGVGCTPDNSSINTISFEFFFISTSEFLPFLCNIDTLESLDVSGNQVSSIPDGFFTGCGRISGLKILNFSGNNLIGSLPSFKNGFRNLETLDFSRNFFSGEIGLQFEGMDTLKILSLRVNQFSGKIPRNLGKWNLLEELVLSYNLFTGAIPIEITKHKNLRVIDLSSNGLTGSIPREFGEFTMLKTLDLCFNYLSGEIPAEITKHKNLSVIDLSTNGLSGSVPIGFGDLTMLKTLDLSDNRLIGGIPSSLSNITTLERFAAAGNDLEGTIPSGITRHLKHLSLSSNKLTGFMPSHHPNLQAAYLSFNDLVGPIPTFNSTAMVYLEMHNNRLGGTFPPSLGNLTNLQVLRLEANNLVGEIPLDMVHLTRLEWLSVGGNFLNSSIPWWISTMHELRSLDLQGSNLRGSVPDSIGNLSSLVQLHLGNNQLSGTIPSMPEGLEIALDLSHNLFQGRIPTTLSRLQNLEVLDMQSNNLVGSIPNFIGNLSRLTKLQLGNNQLSGQITDSLSSLKGLQVLDLQSNNLSGHIPDSIKGLSSLVELQLGNNQLSGRIPDMPETLETALNLSYNQLVGRIPDSLSTLSRLKVLDLSNNRLSGNIPDFFTMFKSHVSVNTSGNKDLIYPSPPMILIPERKRRQALFNSEIGIAVASGFPVGLVISVIAIFISRRYKTIHHHLSPPNSILRSAIDLKKGMEAVSDPSNVSHEARLSTFYKAVMPSGSTYLVKKINRSHNILKFPRIREVSEELEILGNLSHPNVMIPKAYVLTPRRAYLFYDFARGTLHEVLHRRTGNVTLGWASRYSIAVGVAKGLAYLHECSSGPILLLDLCTKSVLLKSLDEPQISDIELCKFIHPSSGISLFSDGYAPPEYGCREKATAAGNVYSYGVLLLELLTGKPAVSDEGAELAEWALTFSDQKSQHGQILDSSVGETSVGVRSQMLAAVEVALACVSVSPEKRPNAVTVLQMLQSTNVINGSN